MSHSAGTKSLQHSGVTGEEVKSLMQEITLIIYTVKSDLSNHLKEDNEIGFHDQ